MRRNPKMQPGHLDERVEVHTRTDADQGDGQWEPSYQNTGTVRAEVEPVRGQETVIADRQAGVSSYRITSYNRGVFAALKATDKLVWKRDGSTVDLNVRWAPDAGRALYRTVEAESGVPQ